MSLGKADEFMAAADACLRLGYPNASASRCYYATFHGAIHALKSIGIDTETWTHEGLHSAFSRELIHRRKVYPASFARVLPESLTIRWAADYREADVSARTAKRMIRLAGEFIGKIKEVSRRGGGQESPT